MTLAIAELILSGDSWTPLNIASRFVEVFHRDPRTGYAGRFYQFLQQTHSGEDFLKNIQPESDKSGAAMRAVPIGLYETIAEVKEKATIQAKVTHDTLDGINAAVACALMSHYFIHNLGAKADVGKFLEQHVPGDWDIPYKGKVKSKGWMSVRAAVTAVKRNDHLSALLKDCISLTGDVDTVATMALGAASSSQEYTSDLPEVLIHGLENGDYGRDYLMQLDIRLRS
jgi:ADP-ribosylglycohydrolase